VHAFISCMNACLPNEFAPKRWQLLFRNITQRFRFGISNSVNPSTFVLGD